MTNKKYIVSSIKLKEIKVQVQCFELQIILYIPVRKPCIVQNGLCQSSICFSQFLQPFSWKKENPLILNRLSVSTIMFLHNDFIHTTQVASHHAKWVVANRQFVTLSNDNFFS